MVEFPEIEAEPAPARDAWVCRTKPCPECPWVRSVASGQFSAERFEAMEETTGSPGEEAALDAPIFACHKSQEGQRMPCAGWLASVGFYSLAVRLAVAMGRLPADALSPGEDWPDLISSYEELTEIRSDPAYDGNPRSR